MRLLLLAVLVALAGAFRRWHAHACDTQLLIFEHVAKTGGSMLTSLLPRQLNITACYPKYHGYSISSSLQQLVENYRCGECGLAAGEWKYSSIAGLGALNLTSRVRVFSVVRDPLMWFLSKVGHDLRSAFVANRYNSVDDALNQAENRSRAPHSYGAMIFHNFQSSHLGMDTVPPARIGDDLRHRFMFVGVSEWMGHSLCALDFHLQRFDATRCNCSKLTTKHGNAAKEEKQTAISVTSAQSKRAFALLKKDVVLHAAALRNLVDDLQRIKLERNVDLLSCFSGDDKA